ncbi:MAG: hypothetical protein AAGD09_11620 [Cyanobacteria bacterium P01_F01_bin.56]
MYARDQIPNLSGSDGSVTDRAIDAQNSRFENQLEATFKSPITLWDGNNKIRQVGGNSPYRPSQVQANGGLAKGDPVQNNSDIIGSTPATGNIAELQAQLNAIASNLATAAKSLGTQIGAGDPNQVTSGVLAVKPRHPNDRYIDLDAGLHYYWDVTAEEWKLIPIREESDGHIPEAENGPVTIIAGSAVDLKILDLVTLGTGTATLSTAPGNILIAGNPLTLTLADTDGSSFSWTLGMIRV